MKALILLVPLMLGGFTWLGYFIGSRRVVTLTRALAAEQERSRILHEGVTRALPSIQIVTADPTTSASSATAAQDAEIVLDHALLAIESRSSR